MYSYLHLHTHTHTHTHTHRCRYMYICMCTHTHLRTFSLMFSLSVFLIVYRSYSHKNSLYLSSLPEYLCLFILAHTMVIAALHLLFTRLKLHLLQSQRYWCACILRRVIRAWRCAIDEQAMRDRNVCMPVNVNVYVYAVYMCADVCKCVHTLARTYLCELIYALDRIGITGLI